MSYDIHLFPREFLRTALSERRGDLTGGPAMPPSAATWLIEHALAAGFVEEALDPGFITFAKAQGHTVGREFLLATPERSAQLTVFQNCATFSIAGSAPSPLESVAFCAGFARQAAHELGLGFYDPQSGEVDA